MRAFARFLSLFVSFVSVAGCATLHSLEPGHDSKHTFNDKTYDQVWNAAIKASTTILTVVESDKEKGVIKCEKGAGMATWGEVVGIFITKKSDRAVDLEVESLKRSSLQITGQNWEKTIIERIKAELNVTN